MMRFKIQERVKLTINDISVGTLYIYPSYPESVFMLVDGEGINSDCVYKHAVELKTGKVTQPGMNVEVVRVEIPVVDVILLKV